MKKLFDNRIGGKVRFHLHDAVTGARTKSFPWESNLVFDSGLNYLAGGTSNGFQSLFHSLQIGSGTSPNSFNTGGSAVFTQAGTTVTCTGTTFFTSAMVGGILKYGASGSSGAEQYISSVNVGAQTCVVSGSGMTVSTAVAGTVWQVQQTHLQTFLLESSSYQTTSGSCGYTISNPNAVLFRTFTYPVQGSVLSVNEVGYYSSNNSGSACYGRIVLGSTVTVPPTSFLVAEFTLTVTASPLAQNSVSNVGVNFDTTGTTMMQIWDFNGVAANGAPVQTTSGLGAFGSLMDGGSLSVGFHNGSISLNSSTQVANTASTNESVAIISIVPTNSSQPVGVALYTNTFNVSSTGNTVNCITIGGNNGGGNTVGQTWVHQLTTPVVLPNGAFQGTISFTSQFSRTLSN